MNPNEIKLRRNSKLMDSGFVTKWGTILAIIIVFLLFTFANWDADNGRSLFLTSENMITVLRSISIITVIAIGLTFSLSVNGMDLSIGATANFADAFIMTMFVWYEMSLGVSIILTILICMSIAAINCLLIVKLKVPDMIASLSLMFMFQGVALTYTGGSAITQSMVRPDGVQSTGVIPEAFNQMGMEPVLLIIMVAVVVFAFFFLTYTKHGRYMYAVGGNPEAARLSGISVSKYRCIAYFMSAGFAALGGILLAARVGTAQVNQGGSYLMPAVAAAFIGFSIGGAGKANAIGTLAGAFLVGMLENGLIMMSVPYYSMDIIKGAVLAVALAMTYASRHD